MSELGLMTDPGLLFMLIVHPSKCAIVNETPVRASERRISFSIIKSPPFLLNILWGCWSTTTITSPDSTPGISSPSPKRTIFSPWGAPFGTSMSNTLTSFKTFFPLHFLHSPPDLIVSPWPSHVSHGPDHWEYIPGPSMVIVVLMPLPWQSLHDSTPSPPFPLQSTQTLSLFTFILVDFPL